MAFFFPDYLGFCAVISFFPLFYFFVDKSRSFKQYFFVGFYWGILVFAVHFVWLLILLLEKLNSYKSFAFFAYGFAVFYFALTSTLWFVLTGLICRRKFFSWLNWNATKLSIFFISILGYFYSLENYALWFLGRVEGYPFLNPLIPLFGFKPFLRLLLYLGVGCQQIDSDRLKNFEFIYLKPPSRQVEQSWIDTEDEIFKELCKLRLLERQESLKEFVIFAPESSFPFPLNRYQSAVELWSNALTSNTHMFIGSQYKSDKKLYQAVYWLNQRRIKNNYVKKHCVPFVEKIPYLYRRLKVIQNVFLGDVCQFSRGSKWQQQDCFELPVCHPAGSIIFIPQICSELFFKSSYKTFSRINDEYGRARPIFIVFFVNDSWFVEFFKKNLFNCAKLKSVLSGVPLIYVGHDGLKFLAVPIFR